MKGGTVGAITVNACAVASAREHGQARQLAVSLLSMMEGATVGIIIVNLCAVLFEAPQYPAAAIQCQAPGQLPQTPASRQE